MTALDAAGVTYTVRRYLDDPPTADELAAVLDRLELEPWHVVRSREPHEEGSTSAAAPGTETRGWQRSQPTRGCSSARSSPPTTAPPWSAATT